MNNRYPDHAIIIMITTVETKQYFARCLAFQRWNAADGDRSKSGCHIQADTARHDHTRSVVDTHRECRGIFSGI